MMFALTASLLFAQLAAAPGAGAVRADSLCSQSLGVRKEFVVYLPPSYDREPGRRYPVVYYLHGVTGDQWNWVRNAHLDATMDSLEAQGTPEMIIVMPDGDDSWYTTWNTMGDYTGCRRSPPERENADSYCVPWPHYDEYIARDLVAGVDSGYRTIADRAHRGIAGLSMGGYGAMSLALRYPGVYGAAASHSGVLSPMYAGPTPFAVPPRYATDMAAIEAHNTRLFRYLRPVFGNDTIGWAARDPARMAAQLIHRGAAVPPLFFDVGTSDPYLVENRAFDYELTSLGIPHVYHEWSGGHTWPYWTEHAAQSLTWLGQQVGGAPAGR